MGFLSRNKTVIESVVSLFLQKLVDLILPLLIIPYFITKVGANNYGIYAFANSIFIYLLNIAQYGFALSTVRDIAVYKNDWPVVNKIFNQVFTTKLYIVLLNSIVIGGLILFVPSIRAEWMLYLFVPMMLIGDLLMPSWFFYGIEKMRFITIVNLILKSTFIILCLFFVRKVSDYKYIMLCQSVGYVFSGIWGLAIVKKFDIHVKIVKFKYVIDELKMGFSSFLNLISPSLYTNTAVFVVGIYCTASNVALIQIAVVVVGIFTVLNSIMTNALYPFLNTDKSKFNVAKNIFIISGAAFSLIMFFTAELVVKVWFGHKLSAGDYKTILNVVRIFSLSPFLMSVVSTYGVGGLLVYRKDKLFSVITIVATVTCFVTAFIFTPIWSLTGAALAIIIGRGLYSFLSFYYYKKIKLV